jgi:hypothetical protein
MQIRHFLECTLVFVLAFLPVPILTRSQQAATSRPASAAEANPTAVIYTARMEKWGKKSTFSVWATDTKAKFSITQSEDPDMPAGFSVIGLDGGQRYIVFVADRRAFVELTADQYRKLREGQAQAHGVEIQDSKREELVVDGDGGLVAGKKTRYFKLRISIAATEDGRQIAFVATEEFWTAPSVPNPAPSLDMLTQQISGIEQLDALLEYKKLRGYPLKRVVQLYENGQFYGSSLVEVTEISQSPIADSVFDIPSDYEKLDISSRLQ